MGSLLIIPNPLRKGKRDPHPLLYPFGDDQETSKDERIDRVTSPDCIGEYIAKGGMVGNFTRRQTPRTYRKPRFEKLA
jgi:hypothetical protein